MARLILDPELRRIGSDLPERDQASVEGAIELGAEGRDLAAERIGLRSLRGRIRIRKILSRPAWARRPEAAIAIDLRKSMGPYP